MEIVEKTFWCDICQNHIDDIDLNMRSSVYLPIAITDIRIDVWNGGIYAPEHICISCQQSIIDHMQKISGKEFLAKGWIKK